MRPATSRAARVARARCSALLTEATLVSSSSATSAGLPAEHFAQDQHRPLPGGQVLQGGDERQPDGVPLRRELGRITVAGQHPGVGDGLHPRVLGQHRADRRLRGRARPQVHRPGPALAAAQHVQADVGGDAVEPRARGRPSLEVVEAPPGPQHRLLHGVIGVEDGAEHPVAVAGQLPAVLLQLFRPDLAAGRFGADRHGHRSYVTALTAGLDVISATSTSRPQPRNHGSQR